MPNKIKMLIVEDNEDERLFMKDGFNQSGLYEITGAAENGNDMLEILNNPVFLLPDIILSDLNMPVRNGYEVIMDVKTNSSLSHIPVIILTTAPLRPYAERCKSLGACAYYTKPDTFLEYREFAEKIYQDVKTCISDAKHDFAGLKGPDRNFIQKIYSSITISWLNSFESLFLRTTIGAS
ncbi:MAG: response regulator [Flavisolibacter sp.]